MHLGNLKYLKKVQLLKYRLYISIFYPYNREIKVGIPHFNCTYYMSIYMELGGFRRNNSTKQMDRYLVLFVIPLEKDGRKTENLANVRRHICMKRCIAKKCRFC